MKTVAKIIFLILITGAFTILGALVGFGIAEKTRCIDLFGFGQVYFESCPSLELLGGILGTAIGLLVGYLLFRLLKWKPKVLK